MMRCAFLLIALGSIMRSMQQQEQRLLTADPRNGVGWNRGKKLHFKSKSWSNWIFTCIILVTCGGLKVAYYSDTAPKRGRPRLRYPMSDFDLSLIREFRSRPAFYDRNSPLFKDKAFNGQAWQEISNILGYDVALLKDRMLQLRNRYNLEKRRLEQLAEENPGKYTCSPWPLYDHLGFLSDHIRSRRSFKRMLPRQSSMEYNMSGGVGSSGGGRGGGSCGGGGGGGGGSSTNMSPQPALSADYSETPSTTNGFLTVKLENTADVETDSQSGTDGGAGDEDNMSHVNVGHVVAPAAAVTSASVSHQNSSSNNINHTSTTSLPALPTIQQSISIRNLDSMRTIIPMHNSHINNNNNYRHNNHHNDTHFNRSSNMRSETISVVPEKKRCLSAREQKYEAFGQFVASSLGEMPKQQALLLVENFTKEVVRVLIEKNSTESSASPNISRLSPSSGGTGLVNNYSNTCSSINQKEELLQVSAQQQRQAN